MLRSREITFSCHICPARPGSSPAEASPEVVYTDIYAGNPFFQQLSILVISLDDSLSLVDYSLADTVSTILQSGRFSSHTSCSGANMPTGKAQTELSTQFMDYPRATRPAISWNEYNDYRNIFVSGLQLLPPLSTTQILLQKIGLASHPSGEPDLVMDTESSNHPHPSPRSKRCRYGSLVVNSEIQEVSTCFVVEDTGNFKASVSEAPELQEWERKVGTTVSKSTETEVILTKVSRT